jgi:hypothetical protein
MMFFFKPKPIYIDCFTANVCAHEYAPIQLANYFLPEWWKQLPKTFTMVENEHLSFPQSTMRRCAGFIDMYSKGLMLPLWSDFSVEVTSEGRAMWRYADGESTCAYHDPQQVGYFFEESNVLHMKMFSPWVFCSKENIQWYFTQPIWNHKITGDFFIPSGVVNYKYQNTTHINMLIKKQDTMFTIAQGTPMAHMVPLSDRPVKIKNHLLSKEEFLHKKELSKAIHFENSYYKKMKILQAKESKCPFNF